MQNPSHAHMAAAAGTAIGSSIFSALFYLHGSWKDGMRIIAFGAFMCIMPLSLTLTAPALAVKSPHNLQHVIRKPINRAFLTDPVFCYLLTGSFFLHYGRWSLPLLLFPFCIALSMSELAAACILVACASLVALSSVGMDPQSQSRVSVGWFVLGVGAWVRTRRLSAPLALSSSCAPYMLCVCAACAACAARLWPRSPWSSSARGGCLAR